MAQKHWTLLVAVIGSLIGLYVAWHSTTYAQSDECSSIAADALITLKTVCQATGRDQICYGHPAVIPDLTPLEENAAPPVFESPGDLLRVIETRSLQLEALDLENGLWGAALMRVQANLPTSSPENVTILIMGGVNLQNERDTLQAFTFSADPDEATCQHLPPSGLLIQTPEGIGEISLLINQVDIRLGSTVLLRAERDQTLSVNLLEGNASVTALDQTVSLVPGESAQIPLIDLFPSERPQIMPIDAADLRALGPFVSVLPRPIRLPPLIADSAELATPIRSIRYGAVVTDTLLSANGHRWQFVARPGDVITITLEKGAEDGFDPYLELRGAEDTLLIENDNYLPDGRAGIFNYTLNRAGTYTIVVRGANGSIGAYKLALSGRAAIMPSPIPSLTPLPGVPNLTIASMIGGEGYAEVTVLNNGTRSAPPTIVRMTVVYVGGSTQTFSGAIGALAPGESQTIEIDAPFEAEGVFSATAIVDPDELIEESNESDNSASAVIEYPED